jgi:hypothetical protein
MSFRGKPPKKGIENEENMKGKAGKSTGNEVKRIKINQEGSKESKK